MSIGLLGKKIGMTHVFLEDGTAQPVTVVDVKGNHVLQGKNGEVDGYNAVQIGYDDRKEQRVNKPELGHFKKHNTSPKYIVREFRLADGEEAPVEGEIAPSTIFQEGQWIDVIGTSKGKGFQGVMKRYGFGGLRQTHGSMMHRRTGAIGAGSTPGRVWKNQKMPGRQGNYRRTVQNLKIVAVREEDGVILISGSFPGAKGSYVVVRPAKKKPAPAAAE